MIVTARDEILGAFKAAWDAGAAAVAGYVPTVFYDGVGKTAEPTPEKHFAEVFVRHQNGSQTALAGAAGARRYEQRGIATVMIFAALPVSHGLRDGAQLAEVAIGGWRGVRTPGGVWFQNCRIVEVGVDGAWYHWNVIAEFRYDEFA